MMPKASKNCKKVVVKIQIGTIVVGSDNSINKPINVHFEQKQKSALSRLFSKIGMFIAKTITSIIAKLPIK